MKRVKWRMRRRKGVDEEEDEGSEKEDEKDEEDEESEKEEAKWTGNSEEMAENQKRRN